MVKQHLLSLKEFVMMHPCSAIAIGMLCALCACSDDDASNEKECQSKADAYLSSLADASMCDSSASDSCAAVKSGTVKDFGCDYVGVNTAAAENLDALRQEYADADCPGGSHPPCPAPNPPAYACVAGDNGIHTCQVSP